MNDPIKDFIEKNRAEFDHLEAPTFDLKKFKARQVALTEDANESVVNERNGSRNESEGVKRNIEPIKEKSKGTRLWPIVRWSAAASVLFATVTYLFIQYNPQHTDRDAQQVKTSGKNQGVPKTIVQESAEGATRAEAEELSVAKSAGQELLANGKNDKVKLAENQSAKANKRLAESRKKFDAGSLMAQLADSSSSSNRLAAIIAIKKKGTLSNYEIDRLASTLNNDNNSNVRLAALDILGIYSKDSYVSSLLVTSLGTQNDPMVQLGLVSLLGNMEHLKIEEKLYALASDPNTFGAVKDEAYSILLNQNKL